MKIAAQTKKQVARDWLSEFTSLKDYAQDKLYKIIGPLVSGIEIFKLPRKDDYRPYFVCYPLWKEGEKACLEEPFILQEIFRSDRSQFSIPFVSHKDLFSEAVVCAKRQIPISLDADVPVTEVYRMVEMQFSDVLVRASPVMQSKLYELAFCVALYVGDDRSRSQITSKVHRASKTWTKQLFDWKYGSFSQWMQQLQAKKDSRDLFVSEIADNRFSGKLSLLSRSELSS